MTSEKMPVRNKGFYAIVSAIVVFAATTSSAPWWWSYLVSNSKPSLPDAGSKSLSSGSGQEKKGFDLEGSIFALLPFQMKDELSGASKERRRAMLRRIARKLPDSFYKKTKIQQVLFLERRVMSSLKSSRDREAKNNIRALAGGARVYFEQNGTLPLIDRKEHCNPKRIPCSSGRNWKYKAKSSRWDGDPWRKLLFGINKHHLAQYCYLAGPKAGGGFEALIKARSDVDCDGTMTVYFMRVFTKKSRRSGKNRFHQWSKPMKYRQSTRGR